MLLLALDTSTLHLSMALAEVGPELRLLAEADFSPGVNHSVLLPTEIEKLLASAGRSLRDLSGFVVGTGPGSFTGLRIGIATVKGLAFALRIPTVGVCSLEAMAWEAGPSEELLVPALDARRGELYLGLYRRKGEVLSSESALLALKPEAVVELLRDKGPLQLFGEGEQAYRTWFEGALRYRRTASSIPKASALLKRCPLPLPEFSSAALAALEPHYVRSAEQEWTLKPKKNSTPNSTPNSNAGA
jgi:tRNA threonylcarbamoyladenosine biosynthesis protein TsaB